MADTQMQNIVIHRAASGDIARLRELARAMKLAKENDYFERQMEYAEKGGRIIFIAVWDGQDAGYCVLNREPRYALFKKFGIPEIQDINVLSACRRRGIGGAMIDHCEALAKTEGHAQMGIGVGLHAGFGSAQRLYVKRGYVPDGTGVNYDRQPAGNGELRPLDDNLCLMMVKSL
jgi:GNAT superfamily N-acetyltransferase